MVNWQDWLHNVGCAWGIGQCAATTTSANHATSSVVKTSTTLKTSATAAAVTSSGTVLSKTTSISGAVPTEPIPVVSQASPNPAVVTVSNTPSPSPSALPQASAVPGATVDSTILVLARDDYSASVASSGFLAYGIPFTTLIVPQAGVALPALTNGANKGNFGGIVVMSAVSYDYSGVWKSALTDAQWNDLYYYQGNFSVRMARLDEFPGPAFGAKAADPNGGGCCATGTEQLVSFTNTSAFSTANVKLNAGVTTNGLWHYPATITDPSTTWEIASFAPGGSFTSATTAGVINKLNGREQMVWFTAFATDWSATSAYLQHSYVNWLTRGLFLGKRKVHLNTQVDDLQLSTEIYYPKGTPEFKLRTGDLDAHITWQRNLNARLPAGSDYWLEFAHNGNGDFISATATTSGENTCKPAYAIDYTSPPDTALEFQKPLGTGTDLWPSEFELYGWTKQCAQLDGFAAWFLNADNLNAFAHLSHTFTHLELNNATYHDATREISFNQAWLKQMGIDQARRFSPKGLVPPAITGLHNGDAIKAWMDNGLRYVVGDNTRPVLKNSANKYYALTSTVASNGLDGLIIVPRFATTIYYNCDTPACTVQEWVDTSAGKNSFTELLNDARLTNSRYLLSLQSDPYMFHQANLRQIDAASQTIGTQTGKMSLIMTWVETVTQEMYRLTNWPITSLKHDDIAAYFINRQTLDACNPKLSYTYASDGKSIASVTVTANGNTCSVPVPVTIPVASATVSGGTSTTDKVGSEPAIVWVTLAGSPVTVKPVTNVAL